MSTKERYHGFWLVQLWPGKEEDFLDTSQFQPISKWKEYGFLWIRICCGFALILLVWIEKDYSFSFWSVSEKSQFTLTKHDLMPCFCNLCALRKEVDFELLMTAATTKTVYFCSSTLQFELRRNDSCSFWSVSDVSQFTLLSWVKMPFSAMRESRLLVVDGCSYCLTK